MNNTTDAFTSENSLILLKFLILYISTSYCIVRVHTNSKVNVRVRDKYYSLKDAFYDVPHNEKAKISEIFLLNILFVQCEQ